MSGTAAESGKSGISSGEFVKRSRFNRRFIRYAAYIGVALLFSVFSFAAGHSFGSTKKGVDNVSLSLHGGLAIDASELRDLVVSQGLTVYWVGPRAGAKYLLDASNPKEIALRYISPTPNSNGANQRYVTVGTYIVQNAFGLMQKAALQPNGVGFVNIDGNYVYYNSQEPNNVYLGFKDVAVQVQIFNPQADQALAFALLQGKIQKIR